MLRQTLQGPMLIVYYTCLSAMYSSWVAPAAVWRRSQRRTSASQHDEEQHTKFKLWVVTLIL